MNQEIENIILHSNYQDLTAEQKMSVNEWASSEEEFETLQQILTTAPILDAEIAPSEKLYISLSESFQTQYGATFATNSDTSSRKRVILWGKIAASVAAVFVLFFMLFPDRKGADNQDFMAENNENRKDKNVQIEKVEVSNDGQNEQKNADQDTYKVPAPNQQIAALSADFHESEDVQMEMMESRMAAPTVDLHSDRLLFSDLPESNKQVIQENPELLSVLYTSF